MPSKQPRKKKTSSQYEDDIKQLYLEVKADPTNKEKQKALKNRVETWEKTLKKTIIRANNETNPWEESNLKMPIRKMPTKQESGDYQTADYICYYEGGRVAGYCGVLVERKGGDKKKGGPQDLYGTLLNAEHCARFYREIERFQEDDRFSKMVVIAECTFGQYLLYVPPFIGKTRNVNHVGASVESRRGKIASLYARGVPVIFADTRYNAIEIYKALIRQWIIKNYVSILKLDKLVYDERLFLENRVAQLEAELQAAKASLESLDMRREGELTLGVGV